MKAALIAMSTNVALTAALFLGVGFYGIPLATTCAAVLSCAWFFHAMHAATRLSAAQLIRAAMVWPALAVLPGFGAAVVADVYSAGWAERMPNGLVAVVASTVLFGSYAWLLRRTPFLDEFDMRFLGDTLGMRGKPGFSLIARRPGRV